MSEQARQHVEDTLKKIIQQIIDLLYSNNVEHTQYTVTAEEDGEQFTYAIIKMPTSEIIVTTDVFNTVSRGQMPC